MLYRASECQKRATSPARVDSSCVNLGGKVATPGSPVTVKTMPVCETEKSHTDSISKNIDVKKSSVQKSSSPLAQPAEPTPRQSCTEAPTSSGEQLLKEILSQLGDTFTGWGSTTPVSDAEPPKLPHLWH